MTELSPKARALIERSRAALRPTTVDRERIDAALQAKLGSLPPAMPPRAMRGLRWRIVTSAALGGCVLGAVSMQVAVRESRQSAVSSRAETTAIVRPAAPPPASDELPPVAAPAGLSAPMNSVPTSKAVAPSAKDRLAVEVELLSRATYALRVGDAGAALEVLDQHQRRFPRGKLRLERRIARARALCTLGRMQEGRAELHDLSSDAPATAHALKACGL